MRSSSPRRAQRAGSTPVGFTLVELLVVIGIIAVLIGVLLPALNKARQQSQAVACLSNMRQLGQGFVMFAQEHNGYLPKAWFNNRPKTTVSTSDPSGMDPSDISASDSWGYRYPMIGWDYVLMKYVNRSKAVFHCPSDDITDSRGRWDNPEFGGFTAAQLPDKFDADDVPGSYRINLSDLPRYQYDAIKITQIRKPTMSIFLLEGGPKAPARLPQDGPLHHVATWELGSAPEARVGRLLRTNVAWDRHGGRNNKVSNYAFADGHAETLQYEATWVPIGPQVWQGSTNFYHQATMWRQRYEVNPDLGPPARPTPQSVQP